LIRVAGAAPTNVYTYSSAVGVHSMTFIRRTPISGRSQPYLVAFEVRYAGHTQ
jgi:hypothetical protein